MTIEEALKAIKNAVYGKDVRQAMHDGILQAEGGAGTVAKEAEKSAKKAEASAKLSEIASRAIEGKADQAVTMARSANSKSDTTQLQLNEIVINGDSSVEAAQARVDIDNIAHDTLKARLDKEQQEVTTQLAQTVVSFNESKLKVKKHLNVFTLNDTTSKSIYWCWVINAEKILGDSALATYYMYYSTDHDGTGYISMAYSDDLLSGWTDYGRIYKNGDLETETPSVMWDDAHNQLIMYFHSYGSYPGEEQTSWLVTSKNGITFDNKQKVLNLNMSELVGDGHNGYFYPFKIGERWYAYHLLGGGNLGRFALSYSDDGYKWVTDHRQLGYGSLRTEGNQKRFISYNHTTPVCIDGVWYLIGLDTNFVSGTTPRSGRVVIVPVTSDFRNTIGKPKKLVELEETGESPNVRQVYVYKEGNDIYVYYQCDNNLHCAVLS